MFPKVFAVTYSSKRVHHVFPLFLQLLSVDSWARQCNKVEFGVLLQLPFVAVYQLRDADGLAERTPAVLAVLGMRTTFRVYNQGLGAGEGIQIAMEEFGTWGEVGKDTSVAGFIAVFDLTQAFKLIGSSSYEFMIPYLVLALFYLVIVGILTVIIKMIERRLA